MADIVPTRSAYLDLQDERRSMQEGYRFLDEKRLVLAGEIIGQLDAYGAARRDFDRLYAEAIAALRLAVRRHGLEDLQCYPAQRLAHAEVEKRTRSVLGVRVAEATFNAGRAETPPAVFPSPEAEHCRRLFQKVLEKSADLAARAGNLQRLWNEYRRTARRARALEDVLLPEMEQTLRLIDAGLEEQDREEAIRVRYFRQIRRG